MSRSLNNFDDRSGDVQASDYLVGYRPSAKGSRFQLSAIVAWLRTQLSDAFAGSNHSHPATGIADSTETGRTILTAPNQTAALAAVGAAASVHTHALSDLQRGSAQDAYVLAWSDTANAWVPTPLSVLTSVQLVDEDGHRLMDEDDALILDEGL